MKHWICRAFGLAVLQLALLAQTAIPSQVAQAVEVQETAATQDQAPASVEVPRLQSPVTDLTGTLDSSWISAMQQRLLTLEQRKGSQIAVLMLPSTGEDSIEQFAIRVFEQWKLGRKGVDDGVLILVAKNDRTMRIEVGYGLEGAIPDAIAARIVREYMAPAFRDGDYAGGIEQAVGALERLVDGEALPEPQRSRGLTREGWSLLFALVCGFIGGIVLRRGLLSVRKVLIIAAGLLLLLGFGAGLKSTPVLLFALPFCLLLGAAVGAVAASSRKIAWFMGGCLIYVLALTLLAHFFGNKVLLIGIAVPPGLALVLALLSLPVIFARSAWKRSRKGFYIRAVIAAGISLYIIYSSSLFKSLDDPSLLFALIAIIYIPALFCFGGGDSGGSSSSSSSSGGGSSSGDSYSGGGGSSGGGGASGSW